MNLRFHEKMKSRNVSGVIGVKRKGQAIQVRILLHVLHAEGVVIEMGHGPVLHLPLLEIEAPFPFRHPEGAVAGMEIGSPVIFCAMGQRPPGVLFGRQSNSR